MYDVAENWKASMIHAVKAGAISVFTLLSSPSLVLFCSGTCFAIRIKTSRLSAHTWFRSTIPPRLVLSVPSLHKAFQHYRLEYRKLRHIDAFDSNDDIIHVSTEVRRTA
jgi:hypothetical protein